MKEIEMVKMNAEEQALFDGICWDSHELGKIGDKFSHLDRMAELAESLFKRNAIPKVRLAYFIEPEMNVGGHGRSCQQVFEKNGTMSTGKFSATRISWRTCDTSFVAQTLPAEASEVSAKSSRMMLARLA